MNEFSILMAKMSNFSIDSESGVLEYQGITTEELCKVLNLQGKYRKIKLFDKLTNFSEYIKLLGLQIKQNPFNNHWFISSKADIVHFNHSNPFEDRPKLGATLYVIIALILSHRKEISIDLIKQYRKKQQIMDDLRQLAQMKFIKIDDTKKISIHPNLGYFIDFSLILDSYNEIDIDQHEINP